MCLVALGGMHGVPGVSGVLHLFVLLFPRERQKHKLHADHVVVKLVACCGHARETAGSCWDLIGVAPGYVLSHETVT